MLREVPVIKATRTRYLLARKTSGMNFFSILCESVSQQWNPVIIWDHSFPRCDSSDDSCILPCTEGPGTSHSFLQMQIHLRDRHKPSKVNPVRNWGHGESSYSVKAQYKELQVFKLQKPRPKTITAREHAEKQLNLLLLTGCKQWRPTLALFNFSS